jgi:hypothetical protein
MFAVVDDMLLMVLMNRQNKPKVPSPDSAGQSGADQGLPEEAEADSESVKELVQEGSSSKQTWSMPLKMRPSRMLPRSALGNFLKTTYRPSTSNRTDYATSDASDPGLITPLRGGKWTVDGRPFRVRMTKAALSISAQKTIEPIMTSSLLTAPASNYAF